MELFDITDIIYSGDDNEYTDEIVLKMASQGYANIVQDDEETRLVATREQIDRFFEVDLDRFLGD